ncbi:large ribosomal subunit protein mL44 [Anopheles ziemanni]|uniref:large ribosomal subunit protein mL44 n=1 Tax=Anopheles coustani TaxID=139045 RepID=UPI002657FD84|nr:large ribosomal subunit protein mL44 [Anopheles coustani]XP_058174264.1 large ribosomal subunit protein mL44 [Anopheles ziemanni]
MLLFNVSRALFRGAQRLDVHRNRAVHRWVAPTLRELRRRREKMGPEALQPRSSHSDWNYSAEIFAFGKRLQENFDANVLQQAFTHQSFIEQETNKQTAVGIEQPVLGVSDNRELITQGEQLVSDYVEAFLLTTLPKLPRQFVAAIRDNLTSESQLAHISSHLGTKDIIMAAEFPVGETLLASTLKAIVAALHRSSGEERCFLFVRDFICSVLNQRNVFEYLDIDDPLSMLREYCKEKNLADPEPRLIGTLGKNTLLAAYNVGIYSNRKLLGTGYGESQNVAIEEAARDCLRKLFGTELYMKPIDFNLGLSDCIQHMSRSSSKKKLESR